MTAQILTFKLRDQPTTSATKTLPLLDSGTFQAIRRRQELDKKAALVQQEEANWGDLFFCDSDWDRK